jgi:hypothetical protein
MIKYFPELSSMINSLENYLICEKHYNQIIAKDIFIQNLINTNLKESVIENKYKEIGIQVSLDQDIFLKLSELESQLINLKTQQLEHINFIKNYKQKITELEILNKNLFFENTELKEKLNMKLDNQEKRIETIIEIAQKERKNIYNDIISLINNQERFTLDNFLNLSISKWLSERNPVIVKFVETLIVNENNKQLEKEKLFKCAIVIDSIYSARNLKYVSDINLISSAIKYSIAKSKKIIDIDNHILSSGSFSKFLKWQENLAFESEPFPKGLVFIAFDNEQKGQKNYLDRNNNTVIYHTVTSFVGFNFNSTEQIQFNKNPWLYSTLNLSQVEQLYNITPEMKTLLDQELYKFLSDILSNALIEKNEEINYIDELIIKSNSNISKQKWCNQCGKNKIENSK